MTPDEREEMNRLVLAIQEEKDREKFASLVAGLMELLDRKEQRLKEQRREEQRREEPEKSF